MFICLELSELRFKHYGLNLTHKALVNETLHEDDIVLLGGGLRVPGPDA